MTRSVYLDGFPIEFKTRRRACLDRAQISRTRRGKGMGQEAP